ncbi:MAG: hypothetical protein PHG65_13185, partial [Kiritimatiellae bacterium]|nr:hypothetical protein [Kiritimatiellia bacterium]
TGNGGQTWTNLTTGVSAALGYFQWNTTSFRSTPLGYWRIVSEMNSNVTAVNEQPFAVRNTPLEFFVNDSQTTGDVYTAVAGSVLADGLTTNTPKADVQAILDTYDLEPGDFIYVDTGSYTNQRVVTVDRFDAGLGTNRVMIQGSTDEVYGGTVFYNNGFWADEAEGVAFRNFTVRNASPAVRFTEADYGLVEWVRSYSASTAFYIDQSDYSAWNHVVAADCSARGIYNTSSRNCYWNHAVIWSDGDVMEVRSGTLGISNSVLRAASGAYVYRYNQGTFQADYNNVVPESGGYAARDERTVGYEVVYPTIQEWFLATGNDGRTLTEQPGFADFAGQDYHLQTVQANGRYVPGPGYATNDAVTSPLIDAGTPINSPGIEPGQNGNRVNIGLFGDTLQASQTPTNAWISVISLNRGGYTLGTPTLRWAAGGLATGHTVRIDYSADNGMTWTGLVAALPAANGQFVWSSSGQQSSPLAYWRITSLDDGAVMDTNDVRFALRNEPLYYYVNDASTNGDVYTTTIGSNTAFGVSSNAPKASVQDVLDTYSLRGGDVIYIDTGVYTNSSVVVNGVDDAGTSTEPVTLQGSTEEISGSVFLDNGFRAFNTRGLAFNDLIVSNASTGLELDRASYCRAERFQSRLCATGFRLKQYADYAQLSRVLAWNSTSYGIYNSGANSAVCDGSVIWGTRDAVYMQSGGLTIENSALRVSGSGRYVYYYLGGTLSADYNAIQLDSGAYVAYRPTTRIVYNSVANWAQEMSRDLHSFAADLNFADAEGLDFHLKTQFANGRYVAGQTFITNDAVSSLLIDAADPDAAFSTEQAPNGLRRNIGLHGNTRQASKTSNTNGWITLVSHRDGGSVVGSNTLYWLQGGTAKGQPVKIEYSWNNGQDWVLVAEWLFSTNYFEWDSTQF